ncbi:Putative Phage anti-repressor protein [Pseudomonas marincola]|uniref:Putative Phage anti-repressor protein n=1 Tax=Pseudomonas marincola TaxID=437900 RepID=A0A653E685_9PSED|nr:antA/AntB antirepressor family protein [Pseudomonas marincola]CAE6906848.1 Putative Phage anti-repressor protein [Pseudomonas marincola]
MNNITAIQTENNQVMGYGTLIPVRFGELNGEVVQLCSARDLYICLGVTTRFNDWVSRRVAEYGFIEGQDFSMVTQKRVTKGRGGDRRSQEYSLSVDMAKELAMVERTEAGRRIRRYFIDCEKQLRKIAPEVAAECLRKALSPKQQLDLSAKVHGKVAFLDKARRRAGYSELWSNLKARHQVAQYRDIPQEEFEEACTFVDSYEWEGEWIGAPKAINPQVMTSGDLLNLNALIVHAGWIQRIYTKYNMYEGFKAFGINAGVELHDHVGSAAATAKALKLRFGAEMKSAEEAANNACNRALSRQSVIAA